MKRTSPASFRRSLAALAVASLPLAVMACAHAPGASVPAEKPRLSRVVVTGSRLPQYVDAGSGLPATVAPVRIYTGDELRGTGKPGLGAALRSLDPGAR